MRSGLPRPPIFVLRHAGEPPVFHDEPVSCGVTFSGSQLDRGDQKLLAFSLNFLGNMRSLDRVSVGRTPGVGSVACIATTRTALTSCLGESCGTLEGLTESLTRVMTARLRIETGRRITVISLLEGFRLYKGSDAVEINVIMEAIWWYRRCLAGLMHVEV